MKGYLLIDYGRDNNDYLVFTSREAAEEKFIKMARDYGESIDDQEVLANDQDDMEELARGGIYSPNGQLILEIQTCELDLKEHDQQKRIEIAFCNVDEEDWPEDIVEHLENERTGDDWNGYERENDSTGKTAVVWEPFEDRSNEELINFIETGDFL